MKAPKVVVLRNSIIRSTNRNLVLREASRQKQRLVAWASDLEVYRDVNGKAGQKGKEEHVYEPLPVGTEKERTEREAALNVGRAREGEKTAGIDAYNFFFAGIAYRFGDDANLPMVGRVTNNSCTGVAIDLDPREPPDDPEANPHAWTLKYPPLALWIRPDLPLGRTLGKLCGPDAPEGCIPMTVASGSFNDTMPTGELLHFRITGLKLKCGYCVTDYFAQGERQLQWLFLRNTWRDGGLIKFPVPSICFLFATFIMSAFL